MFGGDLSASILFQSSTPGLHCLIILILNHTSFPFPLYLSLSLSLSLSHTHTHTHTQHMYLSSRKWQWQRLNHQIPTKFHPKMVFYHRWHPDIKIKQTYIYQNNIWEKIIYDHIIIFLRFWNKWFYAMNVNLLHKFQLSAGKWYVCELAQSHVSKYLNFLDVVLAS